MPENSENMHFPEIELCLAIFCKKVAAAPEFFIL